MLLIQPKPTFWAPAELSVPGEVDKIKLEMAFRYRSRTQLQELFKNSAEKTDEAMIYEDIAADWRGLETAGADGKPEKMPYTLENVSRIVDIYPAAAMEIMTAYRLALTTARQKN